MLRGALLNTTNLENPCWSSLTGMRKYLPASVQAVSVYPLAQDYHLPSCSCGPDQSLPPPGEEMVQQG